MSSILQFRHVREKDAKPLWWGRADIDGLPFRGSAPLLKEAELERASIQVAELQAKFFDMQDPEQMREYLGVMSACESGWFQLKFIERFHNGSSRHYVEWTENYMEYSGSPVAAGGEYESGRS